MGSVLTTDRNTESRNFDIATFFCELEALSSILLRDESNWLQVALKLLHLQHFASNLHEITTMGSIL